MKNKDGSLVFECVNCGHCARHRPEILRKKRWPKCRRCKSAKGHALIVHGQLLPEFGSEPEGGVYEKS